MKKRIVGETPGGLTVMTEWLDSPSDGELLGIETGLECIGWKNLSVEEHDE